MPVTPHQPALDARQPLVATDVYNLWRAIGSETAPYLVGKTIRYDGTYTDFKNYLTAIQTHIQGFMTSDVQVEMLPGVMVTVPTAQAHEVADAYHYWATGRLSYHLQSDLVQALLDTDLQWIEAEPFRNLPSGFALMVPPTEGLSVFCEGKHYPVTDIFIRRIELPQEIELLRTTSLDISKKATVVTWEATSRVDYSDSTTGVLYRSWGSFAIHEDARLDDLMHGLEEWTSRNNEQLKGHMEEPCVAVPNQSGEAFKNAAEYVQRTQQEFLEDSVRHAEEQLEAGLGIVAFIAKFVLFHATEDFSRSISPIQPDGVREKKKLTKKARAIQSKIAAHWGKRFRVAMPPETPEERTEREAREGADGTHASPVRHRVNGYFKNQAYGPRWSLHKSIWIKPFWRGTVLRPGGGF